MIISSGPRHSLGRVATAVIATVLVGAASPTQAPVQETNFLAESQTAMAQMMNAMNVQPSGDVDHDFVSMMVPHHQGAIEMALAELRYGRSEQLRRIAQEIIVEQGQEVSTMRLALEAHVRPRVLEPDEDNHGAQQTQTEGMQAPRSPQ